MSPHLHSRRGKIRISFSKFLRTCDGPDVQSDGNLIADSTSYRVPKVACSGPPEAGRQARIICAVIRCHINWKSVIVESLALPRVVVDQNRAVLHALHVPECVGAHRNIADQCLACCVGETSILLLPLPVNRSENSAARLRQGKAVPCNARHGRSA